MLPHHADVKSKIDGDLFGSETLSQGIFEVICWHFILDHPANDGLTSW
jgi:hypothetical protein